MGGNKLTYLLKEVSNKAMPSTYKAKSFYIVKNKRIKQKSSEIK